MARFGLGKSLSDLKTEMGKTPEISVLAGTDRVSVRNIPLTAIKPNPSQPRKTFADSELIELAKSIQEKGVLQPILLRPIGGRANEYEIIAGERRFRASKMAGKTDIPALIKTIDDNNAMEIALIENVQRENLNPMEEAAAYRHLMERCNYGIGDVVQLIGKSESYIRNSLRLEKLPQKIQKMVETGDLSASHARAIILTDNPEYWAAHIRDKKLSVSETEKLMRVQKKMKGGKPWIPPYGDTVMKEHWISRAAGADMTIREKRDGSGEIAFKFKNRQHLIDLIEWLEQKG